MILALGLAFFFESQATTTVILVSNADLASGVAEDPGLSPSGAIRAEELSRVLKDVDVVQGLDAILVGPGRALRETAEPLAKALNLPIEQVDTSRMRPLAEHILKQYKGDIVLVVTSPAVLPELIPRFQGSKNVPDLADAEYDNLYIVSIPWYGKVKTLRLRYGVRTPAPVPAGAS